MSSYISIASQTVSGITSSVTFNSIPTSVNGKTLRDLVLVFVPSVTSESAYNLRFNNDSNSAYSTVQMTGNGSIAASTTSSGTALTIGPSLVSATTILGETSCIVQVFDFAQTNKHKTVLVRSNRANSGVLAIAGRWASNNAITSLRVGLNNTQNFNAGTFSLYGIEG